MLIPRVAKSLLRCSDCRLKLFTSLSTSFSRARPNPIARSGRALSTSRRLPSVIPVQGAAAASELVEKEEIDGEEEDSLETAPLATDDSLPWYLQVQDDLPSDRRPSERQELPELPMDSPPLLQTFLERISGDMGLDDLTLLDLRHLDPPSALGANLIMVVGTARSEKHLHVAADRFCRYLRSEHKLRPHADGLLGRGELKIRLRRRAKRMKMLAHAGALDARTLEEEMRTGWVCVMVNDIEPPAGWVSPVPKRKDFIGFDERSDKISLVVQMFTEAKRAEIELERLWKGRSDRWESAAEDESREASRAEEEAAAMLVSEPVKAKGKVKALEPIYDDIFSESFRCLQDGDSQGEARAAASG